MNANDGRPTVWNVGIHASDGAHVVNNGAAVGLNKGNLHVQSAAAPRPGPLPAEASDGVDVGILTVLPVEHRAIVDALRGLRGYRTERVVATGPAVHRAEFGPPGDAVRVAAAQLPTPGNEASAISYLGLVRALSPGIVLLVGIAGGIGKGVNLGDVVLSDAVVLYDPRKVTEEGVRHRGDSFAVSAAVKHRLNEFMVETGGRVRDPHGEPVRVLTGPIGAGAAVIADRGSADREWLLQFNDKLLAVETEAAGMARAFHQEAGPTDRPFGWLAVRGISDLADGAKNDDHHEIASRHAAAVAVQLLPHLSFRAPALGG
jgi:adenosylhomocysteine nucleosidase